jgi:hypothetical protein
MPLQTRLTTALGTEHPILLAPMDLVAGGKLAAAVSHAGGLGLIGGGYGNADWLEQELAAAGNARVGCGFITWSLAKKPDLLDFRVPDTSGGQGRAWELHRRLLQPRPASFDTGLCQSGSVQKAGRIATKPLSTKPKQIHDGSQVEPLLDQITVPLASFVGDGAYDQAGIYGTVAMRNPDADVIIPPRSTAVLARMWKPNRLGAIGISNLSPSMDAGGGRRHPGTLVVPWWRLPSAASNE